LRAVVGLGANLGDRASTLREAAREIGRVARVVRTSHMYATAPVGRVDQPEFLNAAALVDHDGPPEALLDALLAIEGRLGRVRVERWAPRAIDLDVLWIEGVTCDGPRLVVPHPELQRRAFALVPLLEIAPGARDPRTGEVYQAPPGDVRDTGEAL
jgi:2-amino-4-hydroxy-6-hydroxymethyldihydropteridine diphosphokinase